MKLKGLVFVLFIAWVPAHTFAENTMSRDDIIDFCDSIPQDSEASKVDERTLRAAKILGANEEQAKAMNLGAVLARVSFSFANLGAATSRFQGGSVSPDDKKSFQSFCKAKVREQLYKLTEK